MVILVTLTPLATAAVVDRPVARKSKPNRVLLRMNQNRKPASAAPMTKP